jgi:hypothetical protein
MRSSGISRIRKILYSQPHVYQRRAERPAVTVLVILKTGNQREVHVRFDEALNAAELIHFVMGNQGYSLPFGARTSGAANAVDVILRHYW